MIAFYCIYKPSYKNKFASEELPTVFSITAAAAPVGGAFSIQNADQPTNREARLEIQRCRGQVEPGCGQGRQGPRRRAQSSRQTLSRPPQEVPPSRRLRPPSSIVRFPLLHGAR